MPLTEVSTSEMLAILTKFFTKELTSEATIWKLSWQPCCVYVTSFRPTQNWWEEEKPATDLASVSKIHFFQAVIHLLSSNAIISEVGPCLTQIMVNNSFYFINRYTIMCIRWQNTLSFVIITFVFLFSCHLTYMYFST